LPVADDGEDQNQKSDQEQSGDFTGIDGFARRLTSGLRHRLGSGTHGNILTPVNPAGEMQGFPSAALGAGSRLALGMTDSELSTL